MSNSIQIAVVRPKVFTFVEGAVIDMTKENGEVFANWLLTNTKVKTSTCNPHDREWSRNFGPSQQGTNLADIHWIKILQIKESWKKMVLEVSWEDLGDEDYGKNELSYGRATIVVSYDNKGIFEN